MSSHTDRMPNIRQADRYRDVLKVRTWVVLSLGCALLLSGCSSLDSGRHSSFAATSDVKEDAWVVVINDPRSSRQLSNLRGPAYNARLSYADDPILHRYASSIADDHSVQILSEWPLKNLGVHCFLVSAKNSDMRSELEQDERVLWVQPFNEFELKSGAVSAGAAETQIKDRFAQQFKARGRNIRVAVVDTAVDRTHPDLLNTMLKVRNFSGDRGQPASELHGTAVVGVISANPRALNGVRGIASDANTHLLRGCWQDSDGKGRCNTLTLALALDAAIALQPDIINLSLSGAKDRILDQLIKVLTRQGSLVVAAFDDTRKPQQRFPSPGPGVIYAYGLDKDQRSAPRSANVLFASKHVVSLAPMSGYDLVSGHSVAAPQLTGMAAVLMDVFEEDDRGDIVARLGKWLDTNYGHR